MKNRITYSMLVYTERECQRRWKIIINFCYQSSSTLIQISTESRGAQQKLQNKQKKPKENANKCHDIPLTVYLAITISTRTHCLFEE